MLMTYDDAHDDICTAKTPPGYVYSYEKNLSKMTKLRDPKTGKYTSKPKPTK
jgi:hypothetical protein